MEGSRMKAKKIIQRTLSSFILTVFIFPSLMFAGIKISGKVVGADNHPLKLAHVHLAEISSQAIPVSPLRSVTVDKNGNFSLSDIKPGLYRLFFTGVDHMSFSVPHILDKKSPDVEITVRMALLNYMDKFDAIKIIGSWNGFNFRAAADMEKQPNGTFTYQPEVSADTVSYQLLITKDGRSVNGTQSDYFVYDGGGDYRSVLRVKGGKVKIVFDPKKLPRTNNENLPSVSFGKKNKLLQKLWSIETQLLKQQKAFTSALETYRKTHTDLKDFHYDWSKGIAMLKDHMEHEKAQALRQYSAIQLGTLVFYRANIDSTTMAGILKVVPPGSDMWSVSPSLLYLFAREKKSKELFESFLNQNPNRLVRALALSNLLMKAVQEKNNVLSTQYYNKLKSEYADLQETQYILKRFDPNRRIQPGKPIPDFEVKLMGSGKKISNKNLLGKFYMMDFWASWCGPCLGEMQQLHTAYKKFKDKNFVILSLSFDGKPEDALNFRKQQWKMPWLHTFVENGFRSKVAQDFEVTGIPKPILVGPAGKILEVGGALRGENLEKTLARYLER